MGKTGVTILTLLLLAEVGLAAGANPRIVVLANSIDYELAADFFGFLGNRGIEVVHSTAADFDQYKQDKFIVVIGGPDAYEGVGEIVQEILSEDEQNAIRQRENRKKYVKIDPWGLKAGQRVTILAGSDRHQTRKTHEENRDDVISRAVEAYKPMWTPTPPDKVKIAAFNIQVFGKTKAGKPEVMEVLLNIARNFDIIAIQEIRDKSLTTMPKFKEQINSMEGPDYGFIIGPRLGRTTSKEQYAYLYNTQTIEVIGSGITYPEPSGDVFHREPFIAPFKAKGGNFDFVLITIHTDPDEATEEINSLPEVVEYAGQIFQGERDFIVLGDFNADCSYFDEDSPSPLKSTEYTWIIENEADTTTKTTDCTYDRIIITGEASSDYAGTSGVFGFDTVYGLTYDQTTAVSDHYPVYAEFWTNKDTD